MEVPTTRSPLSLFCGFQVARHGEQHAIAIDDAAGVADKKARSASPSKATPSARRDSTTRFGSDSEMERTAAGVDIAAVGRDADGDHFAPRERKARGRAGGAIGAIEDDAESGELARRE